MGAVNHFNFTVLHSISLFCTDLGLIDMPLTNQNAEIVACILVVCEHYDLFQQANIQFFRLITNSLSTIE